MAKAAKQWKRGRGKLGGLAPLLGSWRAATDSEMGPLVCTRTFAPTLDGTYVQLTARWAFKQGSYEELALYGVDAEGSIVFWSFTSDGKRSTGAIADVTDIHPDGIGFEAQVPAGLARMAYWPDEADGYFWVVESKHKKGWRRFTEHHYLRVTL